MHCRDIMLSYVYRCHPDEPVSRCAALMREANVGFIPVIDARDHLVGVVTDRDIALRVVAAERPADTRVEEVMTGGELVTCREDEPLEEAESRMAHHRKSRLPVVDREDRCVGIVSLSDIAQSERPIRAGELLREVTRREAVVVAHPEPGD